MTIWLLDIDGVVNAFSKQSPFSTPFKSATIFADGLGWTFNYHPEVLSAITSALEAGVDVRLSSTWVEAPEVLWAEFGFKLPLAFEAPDDRRRISVLKLWTAQDLVKQGERVIWTDDDVITTWDEQRSNDQKLFIRPSPNKGLTPDHLEKISAFIAL